MNMTQQPTEASKSTPAKAVKGKPATIKSSKGSPAIAGQISAGLEDRHDMIATAAYYRAEQRGFHSGHEMEDWLAAEAEVDSRRYH